MEYWFARDIMRFLGYSKWENFNIAIERAKVSGNVSKTAGEDHFPEVRKMVELGSGSRQEVKNRNGLACSACCPIALNEDPRFLLRGLEFGGYCNCNTVAI